VAKQDLARRRDLASAEEAAQARNVRAVVDDLGISHHRMAEAKPRPGELNGHEYVSGARLVILCHEVRSASVVNEKLFTRYCPTTFGRNSCTTIHW
jgi:hypothetical protein